MTLSSHLPLNLRELMGCIACPARACRRPLSQNDMRNLLAANTLEEASPPPPSGKSSLEHLPQIAMPALYACN